MSTLPQRWNLIRHFVLRDLKQRYLGSLSGGLWAVLQPLLLLGVYAFVFVEILRVRNLPAAAGGDFVVFLVAGLWPWTAFAEALNRSVTAIQDHAGLLSKVALPREVLVLAPVTSAFLLHGVGFVAVTLALAFAGKDVDALGLPAALAMFALLYAFALGLALVLAALQVFVRDLGHMLGQFLTLWFFLTPVFYTRDMVPPAFATVLSLNPVSPYVDAVRGALHAPLAPVPSQWALAALYAALALAAGAFVFRRLSRHFEDFL
jgi:ABC-type polysaccharide/polyol phosphate export permease